MAIFQLDPKFLSCPGISNETSRKSILLLRNFENRHSHQLLRAMTSSINDWLSGASQRVCVQLVAEERHRSDERKQQLQAPGWELLLQGLEAGLQQRGRGWGRGDAGRAGVRGKRRRLGCGASRQQRERADCSRLRLRRRGNGWLRKNKLRAAARGDTATGTFRGMRWGGGRGAASGSASNSMGTVLPAL